MYLVLFCFDISLLRHLLIKLFPNNTNHPAIGNHVRSVNVTNHYSMSRGDAPDILGELCTSVFLLISRCAELGPPQITTGVALGDYVRACSVFCFLKPFYLLATTIITRAASRIS